jgi:aminoglycoside phosphotransferase (APT) family kinase protein
MIQPQLETYCRQCFSQEGEIRVEKLECLNSGWESDVYAFTLGLGAADAGRTRPLIARLYSGEEAAAKARQESAGMRWLYQRGYPVPEVLTVELDPQWLGRPFMLMEQVPGDVLWPTLFHGPDAQRPLLLRRFCELLVQLHALDWHSFVDDPTLYGDTSLVMERDLRYIEGILKHFAVSDFQPGLDWLTVHGQEIASWPPALVHLDYHPANVILQPDGACRVIDWTQFGVGDPRMDLAWTLLLVGTHEDWRWREPILQEYERLSGHPVEDLAYFEALASFKRLLIVAISVRSGAASLGMRPGAEAQIRRQAPALKQVYDRWYSLTQVPFLEMERWLAESMP